jgi:RHS repeat-associated protein
MSNKSGVAEQVISLPKGGGALKGLGEKFQPDLHTGTGNFSIPIALPPGRNGFQPQLNLSYSTGSGNSPFGLGWSLSISGVSRQTSKSIPRYRDRSSDPAEWDTFILSGAEDLVPVALWNLDAADSSKRIKIDHPTPQDYETAAIVQFRPRTEGLFAQIFYHRDAPNNYWEVRSKDGLVSLYGSPGKAGVDPAVIVDPAGKPYQSHVFAWKLTQTTDPFGNRIEYQYKRDSIQNSGSHQWDQLYLSEIRYVDYGDPTNPQFLVTVRFNYENRPDPFSEYRASFEVRTVQRCTGIEIYTHPGEDRLTRSYQFIYLDQRELQIEQLLPNKASLLSQVKVIGHDNDQNTEKLEKLPPLEFSYTPFELEKPLEPEKPLQPKNRKFFPVGGRDLPAQSLASPDLELADLFGHGLPDIMEMNDIVRYWRNLGEGKFDLPREMKTAPAGLQLADPGVQLLDADGDARIDLLVTTPGLSGYYPLQFDGNWDQRSFHRYPAAPSVNLEDPEVKLVDLTGNGVIDAIRSGTAFECFFNDPKKGWNETRKVTRKEIADFPNVNFSDPRVKWGDMTGDGLQDIVLVHNGTVEYWPNLGYGNWGKRITMQNCPRFPYGYNPKRILVGDVDGDGLADLLYIDNQKIMLWINRSGNGWSDPIEIRGSPPVTDMDSVRLVDLLGTGVSGILWSAVLSGRSPTHMFFLDLTGGTKPYLLNQMDNHIGAVTKVKYQPSTHFYLQDQQNPKTRWQTSLPFPVQVVAKVEVVDQISCGKLTTEYFYHHGYWDGLEREFRGFGRVDQRDTEVFEDFHAPGLHPSGPLQSIQKEQFSPPLETRTWFHQGAISDRDKGWTELDYSQEFWSGDPQRLSSVPIIGFLKTISGDRRVQRDALRALRGTVLRTELYALDGSDLQKIPYTVTESLHGLREEAPPEQGDIERKHIFFPFALAERTTQWERGNEPMTQFKYVGNPGQKEPNLYGYDSYGQPLCQLNIAVPRYRDYLQKDLTAPYPYLSTYSETTYAQRDDDRRFIVDRVAKTTTYEITNDGTSTVFQLRDQVYQDPTCRKMMGQTLNFYDGAEFVGLNFGQVGDYGALVRSLTLIMTEDDLQQAYGANRPPHLTAPVNWPGEYPPDFSARIPTLAGYIDQPNVPDSAAGYFVATERRSYDFHHDGEEKRGLVRVKRDSLGHDITISYDEPAHPYRLLPTKVTDPVGLQIQATYDYRVLQPLSLNDPNGNQTEFHFSPLGLPREIWVKGNPSKSEGDLTRPSTRFEYDFLAFEHHQQPIYVRSLRQIHHDTETDVDPQKRDEAIATVEYSDGFGRLLQTRTQAEEITFGNSVSGDAGLSADPAAPHQDAVGHQACPSQIDRVVVSGWQIYDNKGRVVEKYEPFFGCGWDYAPPTTILSQLAKVTMFYDPRGQVIRTVNPDSSEQFVIYGKPIDPNDLSHMDPHDPTTYQPTPWEAYTFDPNDNAGRTAGAAAQGYQHHWNTPASIVIDGLGRTIEAVQRNRDQTVQPGDPLPPIVECRTRSEYDIRGNLLSVTDPLGRRAFEYVYDLANRPLRTNSIDAGTRRIVLDAAGNEIERRDSKGALILHAYDRLNRPIRLWARDDGNQSLSLRQWLEYGDGSNPNQPGAERSANRDANRLGKLSQHYDEAGLLTLEQYDFKGNLLEKVRQVVDTNKIIKSPTFQIDWQLPQNKTLADHAKTLLNPTEYRTSSTYDALNRIKLLQYPQDTQMQRKQLLPHYNRAGALEQVEVDGTPYVKQIAYNAKGQRTLIAYGNGVMTRYAYDPQTFRLVRLRSEDYTTPNNLTFHPTGAPLQDLMYDYDLVGNIVRIHDRTPSSGVQGERLGADALDRVFSYDPLYRLLSATGRECQAIPQPRPWMDDQRSGNGFFNRQGVANWDNAPNLTALYQEEYAYDAAGNMLTLKHQQSQRHNGGITWETIWTRSFGMAGRTPEQWDQEWRQYLTGTWQNPPGNQLTHVEDRRSGVPTPPTVPQTHWYDLNGNLIQENQSRFFEWDYADRLRGFRVQSGDVSPSVQAQYLYDASGQRVMKVVRKQDGIPEVTVYIDGIFEHHLWQEEGTPKQNNWLHIMDNQQRIAIVRVGDRHKGDTTPEVQYHLGDHLGSSSVVVDEEGGLVNCEEYFPYGEASFGSFARKRYRFTGKERDEESGLYYHGARYYASWLARWTSCDPAVLFRKQKSFSQAFILNSFIFCKCCPIVYVDQDGKEAKTFFITVNNPLVNSDRYLEFSHEYGEQHRAEMIHLKVESLDDMVNQLKKNLGSNDTIKAVTIVTHGEKAGDVLLPSLETYTADSRRTYQTPETLKDAAFRLKSQGLLDIQQKAVGAKITLLACEVGNSKQALESWGNFFGGKELTVEAPKIFVQFYKPNDSENITLRLDKDLIKGGEISITAKSKKEFFKTMTVDQGSFASTKLEDKVHSSKKEESPQYNPSWLEQPHGFTEQR